MADIDNFAEINENFDTIKTLLNSIRAQGILSTTDVDKLLTNINEKLEKLDTGEDIDVIKLFLSELKSNFDERHNVLLSKFGAIESLFSNLMKSNSELPKGSELKELFDIVATNLSVFSREVVAQKESLSDITLRLDSLRTDDTQKKDIIKNITLLRPDIERLNNGFDSIVLSLNENFKTIIKAITSFDKSESLDKFAGVISNMEMSSNTILSAIQVLDKKAEQVDNSLKTLATKDDINNASERIFDLTASNQELSAAINDLSEKYVRVDSLAEKIDATVSIIAGLKTVFDEVGDKNTGAILEQLKGLENELKTVSSNDKFNEFKLSLETVLNRISDSNVNLNRNITTSFEEIQRIIPIIRSLDINTGLQNLTTGLNRSELELKTHIDETSQRLSTLQDANITRVLNDISASADTLSEKLNQTQTSMNQLCEKNFDVVNTGLADLKSIVSQIDENGMAANNAVFASITDRLTLFETSLKTTLDSQESSISSSSAQIVEQLENVKRLSGLLDSKLDSSVMDALNIKKDVESLNKALESVLALDFVSVVKDIRVDLDSLKNELTNNIESVNSGISDKLSADLFSKYELLITKLNTVEEEFKRNQTDSLLSLRSELDNIASSIVDVLSFVKEKNAVNAEELENKISGLTNAVQEQNMNYVENVRSVVDVIRVQVETNLLNIEEASLSHIESVKQTVKDSSEDVKNEIRALDSKMGLLEDSGKELKALLNAGSLNADESAANILTSTESIKRTVIENKDELKNDIHTSYSKLLELEDSHKELKALMASGNGISDDAAANIFSTADAVRRSVEENKEELKNEIQNSFAKLLEIEDAYQELKALINVGSMSAAETYNSIAASSESVKNDFEDKLNSLKGDLMDKLSVFSAEFTNENSNSSNCLKSISDTTEHIRGELQTSYSKLLDIEESYNQVREYFRNYNDDNSSHYAGILAATEAVKNDFEYKMSALKDDLLDKLSRFNNDMGIQNSNSLLDFKVVADDLENLKQETLSTLAKLSDFGDAFETLKALIDTDKYDTAGKYANIISISEAAKAELDDKVNVLKGDLTAALMGIKQELTDLHSVSANNILENNGVLMSELQTSYSKLLELEDAYKEIKSMLESSSIVATDKYSDMAATAEAIKTNIEEKLAALKKDLYEQVSTIRQDINVNNINNSNDLRTVVENTDLLKSVAQDSNNKLAELDNSYKTLITTAEGVKLTFEEKIASLKRDLIDLMAGFDGVRTDTPEAAGGLKEILDNTQNLRNEIQYSYSKLLEVEDAYNEIKNMLNANNVDSVEKYNSLLSSAAEAKQLIEDKINSLKQDFTMTLTDFKFDLTNISNDSTDELKLLSDKSDDLKKDIQYSYSKLLELEDAYKEIRDMLACSGSAAPDKYEAMLAATDNVKTELENGILSMKTDLLATLSGFKQDLAQGSSGGSAEIRALNEKSEDLKNEVINTYSKILELQDSYNELRTTMDVDSIASTDRYERLIESAYEVRSDFELRMSSLENSLLARISGFKQELASLSDNKIAELKLSLNGIHNQNNDEIKALIDELKGMLGNVASLGTNERAESLTKISENLASIRNFIEASNDSAAKELSLKVDMISNSISSLKAKVEEGAANQNNEDLSGQLAAIENTFESLAARITALFEDSKNALTDKINHEFFSVSENMQNALSEKLEAYKLKVEDIFDGIRANAASQTDLFMDKIAELSNSINNITKDQTDAASIHLASIVEQLKESIDDNIKLTAADYVSFKTKIGEFTQSVENGNKLLAEELKAQLLTVSEGINTIINMPVQSSANIPEGLDVAIKASSKSLEDAINNTEKAIAEKIESLKMFTTDISAGELQSLDTYVSELTEQIDAVNLNIQSCKDLINNSLKRDLDIISTNIEKETDVVIGELTEQFDILKRNQADDVINLTSRIEEVVSSHIYNNIEELKSYIDGKTEDDQLGSKFDDLQGEIVSAIDNVVAGMNKLLDSGAFTAAMSDYRLANEILVNSALDNINGKIETFISQNLSAVADVVKENGVSFEEKLALFDKKFVDTLVDKYEEIKLISNRYNESFESIQTSIESVLSEFSGVKSAIDSKFDNLMNIITTSSDATNKEVRELTACLEGLRSQISNKSFDEAFQASINKQISSIETLISEQLGYIEDINDLCSSSLPDVTELNTLVKHSILNSIKQLSDKLNSIDVEGVIGKELLQAKLDIASQISVKLDEQAQGSEGRFDKGIKEIQQVKSDIISSFNDKIDAQNIKSTFDKGLQLVKDEIVTEFAKALVEQDIAGIFEKGLEDNKTEIVTEVSKTISEQDIKGVVERGLEQAKFDLASDFADILAEQDIVGIFGRGLANNKNEIVNELTQAISDQDVQGVVERELERVKSDLVSQFLAILSEQDIAGVFERNLQQTKFELVSQFTDKLELQDIPGILERSLQQIKADIVSQFSDKLAEQDIQGVFERELEQIKADILEQFADMLDTKDLQNTIEDDLNKLKADIITQILNVFNQISFVTEQEEILEFIQDKHDDLISILSHIVTTTEDIKKVNRNVAVVDNKIDELKEEICSINEKITSIISSNGDIDYIYSLQDLESDIANLRIVLNEMKENDHGEEFKELISSTNDIYNLVEAIKAEFPNKRDIEEIAENIVSISTRTNKLILASDESYKTLQDNLKGFKVVIDDLDERTRNFVQDAGIDVIDSKLNAINSMMQNGAKTNQIFNQVFEYLAEWVDNAGVQINTISDRIGNLDEISQIKTMLEDLKAESVDSTESLELVEALGAVFDKQTKRISSLETKLDKIIVENTVHYQQTNFDIRPLEETFNRFLVAMDEKIAMQQNKIDSLESKLENALSMLDGKETAQLTKKMGGMDRQIAKLNKSIEKIASHVIEK